MSGARAIPVLLMLLLITMSLGGFVNAEQGDSAAPQDQLEYTTLPRAGGTVWVSTTLLENAGDRFLEFIEPPEFTRTQAALENPVLVPGDKGDHGGEENPIITQRRVTDYSYMQEPYTGGMRIEDVHAGEEGWLCICDADFVMENQDGLAPTVPDRLIHVVDSSKVWIDNITFHGGVTVFDGSEQVITSDSVFIDSGGILSGLFFDPSNHGMIHNTTFINQRGPLNPNHMPNPPEPLGDLLSEDPMCWPHDINPCTNTGILLVGGRDWTVEWSHMHGDGIIATSSAQRDMVIRHNTLYDAGMLGVSGGTNEISWNLVRGNWAGTNLDSRTSDYTEIHNNSIIRPFKIGGGIDSGAPGLEIINCDECMVHNNDFIGFGRVQWGPDPAVHKNGEVALRLEENLDFGFTDVTSNYWGSIHDPREPEDVYITVNGNVELALDEWHTQPTHPVTPIVQTADPRDAPYWAEQITGLPLQDS